MGNTTVLSGYIYAPNEGATMNAASVAALPNGDNWPYLTSDLFSVPRLEHTYNGHVITFGTTFKNFDFGRGWPEWRAKFEALLRSMSWNEAHVYLDIELLGCYHFTWTQDMWQQADWRWPQDAQHAHTALREILGKPVERWTFSGGPVGEANH